MAQKKAKLKSKAGIDGDTEEVSDSESEVGAELHFISTVLS